MSDDHVAAGTRHDGPVAVAGRRLDSPWAVVVLALVVAAAGFAFSQLLPWAVFEWLDAAGASLPALAATTLQLLLIAALSVVLVGPMEELFFRGIVQETMREALPPRFAIPLASAAFASVHVFAYRGQAVLLGALFLNAMVLGFAYERTRNLGVVAAIHGGYNAVLALLAYAVIVSGLAPTEAAALLA